MSFLDITMTAVLRPEIIERTLHSFKTKLFKNHECRLIINIDPVGNSADLVPDIIKIVEKYFPNFIYRFPHSPSFPKAFIQIWKTTSSEFVFNLEDDWELLRDVDLDEMIQIMRNNPNLASLRLNFKQTDKAASKNWGFFFPWNGSYFECPKDNVGGLGFCGHPSLLRGAFVRESVKLLNPNSNPEKQFHTRGGTELMKLVMKNDFGVFAKPNQSPTIRDIGREWLINQPWRKKGVKAFFTKWEIKE